MGFTNIINLEVAKGQLCVNFIKGMICLINDLLIRTFVKDYENIEKKEVRDRYGFVAGTFGIIINILLFFIKLIIGMISNSVAIMADSFNNLSDVASSIITIIGFKFSSKPADKEHPFGHGRIEYFSGLIVAILVMLVGYELVKSSFDRILNPSKVIFEMIPFIILLISILFKIWLSSFNNYIGKKINSTALKASGFDALGDVISTSTVVLAYLISNFTQIPIDGYIGIIVALFIIFSGFKLVKETVNPLLGEAPSDELMQNIVEIIMGYEYISGVHDLIVHNYGPSNYIASIHAEIPRDIDIIEIHEIIDDAENEVQEKLGIAIVIHMDPVLTDDEYIRERYAFIKEVSKGITGVKSIHDFRIIGKDEKMNFIFDVVLDGNEPLDLSCKDRIKGKFQEKIKEKYPLSNCIINIEADYFPYN